MPPSNSPADYRFCPYCGTALQQKVLREGNPPRAWCDACGFVAYLDPKVAVCTISMLDGGIVLAKRANPPEKGKWVFPGGFVDRGEAAPDAAIRETQEEVNLRVGLTGILDAYSVPGEDVLVIVYAAHVLHGRPEPGQETEAVAAFKPEDIPWDELGFQTTRMALLDYLHRFYPRVRTR